MLVKTLLFSVEKLSYYTDFMKKTHISYWYCQFIRCDLNIDNHDFYSVTGTPRIVQYCTQLVGLYKRHRWGELMVNFEGHMEVLGQDSGIPDTNLDLYISRKGNIKEMEWVLLMEYVWMTLSPDLLSILAPQCFFFFYCAIIIGLFLYKHQEDSAIS